MTIEDSGNVVCPRCGGAIKARAVFCRHCRTDLGARPTDNASANPSTAVAPDRPVEAAVIGDRPPPQTDWRDHLHPLVRAALPLLFVAVVAPLLWAQIPSSARADDVSHALRFWREVGRRLPAGQVAIAPRGVSLACQNFSLANVGVTDPANGEAEVTRIRDEALRDPAVRACAAQRTRSFGDFDENLRVCVHISQCLPVVWTAEEVRERTDGLAEALQREERDRYAYGAAFLGTFLAAFALAVYLRVPTALAVRAWLKTGPDGKTMS